MPRSAIAALLPFFAPREVPERAASPEESLSVHTAMQRVGTAYERFRNLLDPGDEDILRRKAIVRFLARRWAFAVEPERFAFALLKDLASGAYIPQTTHRRYAVEIAAVVEKAFHLWRQGGRVMHPWLLPVIAVEIDRLLYPRDADDALVYVFYEDVRSRLVWEDPTVAAADRDTQLFLACHRALAKTDDAELFWHLLRTAEPRWPTAAAGDDLALVAATFPHLQGEIVGALRHPAAVRLLRVMQPLAVPYRILRDLLRQEHASAILESPELLRETTRAALAARVTRFERQMLRRVWHAALFLFFSKGVLAFALEIPYELFLGGVRVVPLVINIVFPPTLLFLMTGSVPRPGRANTERLADLLQNLVSGEDELAAVVLRSPARAAVPRSIFALTYGLVTILVLTAIVALLRVLHFSLVGGGAFLMFLALVSFLGLRLRSATREFRIVAPRVGLRGILIDFFTLPILDLGRQIALRASQVNVFLFLLDAVIEAPFKVLLGLVEEWFAYLRERKEELV